MTRITSAIKATFGTEAKNKPVNAGDPSYTSGTQAWNGKAYTLKKRPQTTKQIPTTIFRKSEGFS